MMKQSKAIEIKQFQIKDSFWSPYRKLVREEVIPYQHAMLEDIIPDAEKSHAIENFRIAAGVKDGEFYGMVFQDSDVAKWIEACAFSLINTPDAKLEETVDEIVELIEKAQLEDGYVNTYFTIKDPGHRWTDLQEGHELYCAGHMIEAAVAYYEATGKDKLLKVMMRMADHIDRRFGEHKVRGFAGHPEIELALMKLYRTTGEKRYLKLCEYFINERGTQPNYFKEEQENRGWSVWNSDWRDVNYTQNYAPVREQKDAVGHSVRAVYLYTGMADLASEINDSKLKTACDNLWESITKRRMYLTGGIGSTVIGEAFTEDFDLPNDTVYAETCASIGLIFFAQKMLGLSPKGEYADVMERALYNTVLAGMSQDGKRFFYVNPLEITPGISGKAQTHRHALPERPKWFGCACCPPNVARMVSSLELYSWFENNSTIFSNHYIRGVVDFSESKGCKIITETNYPFEGNIKYKIVSSKANTKFTLAIRIPAWSDQAKTQLILNDTLQELPVITKDGYAYLEKAFLTGDEITLKLDMTPYRIYSSTLVRNNEGCAALQCGPLVYCFEGIDNDGDVHSLRLDKKGTITVSDYKPELLGGIRTLAVSGYKMHSEEELYSHSRPVAKPYTLTAIPYYAWGNRGLNQMRVWMPEE
ncbi:MAG: glycoside hydrolase family 127 protein [Mobilitalea sp.]